MYGLMGPPYSKEYGGHIRLGHPGGGGSPVNNFAGVIRHPPGVA